MEQSVLTIPEDYEQSRSAIIISAKNHNATKTIFTSRKKQCADNNRISLLALAVNRTTTSAGKAYRMKIGACSFAFGQKTLMEAGQIIKEFEFDFMDLGVCLGV